MNIICTYDYETHSGNKLVWVVALPCLIIISTQFRLLSNSKLESLTKVPHRKLDAQPPNLVQSSSQVLYLLFPEEIRLIRLK